MTLRTGFPEDPSSRVAEGAAKRTAGSRSAPCAPAPKFGRPPSNLKMLASPTKPSSDPQVRILHITWLLPLGVLVPQGADPPPSPPLLYVREGRKKSFERGNYPPPPHWDRRAIQPNHIKFRTCNALAPIWNPQINERAEQLRGPSS